MDDSTYVFVRNAEEKVMKDLTYKESFIVNEIYRNLICLTTDKEPQIQKGIKAGIDAFVSTMGKYDLTVFDSTESPVKPDGIEQIDNGCNILCYAYGKICNLIDRPAIPFLNSKERIQGVLAVLESMENTCSKYGVTTVAYVCKPSYGDGRRFLSMFGTV